MASKPSKFTIRSFKCGWLLLGFISFASPALPMGMEIIDSEGEEFPIGSYMGVYITPPDGEENFLDELTEGGFSVGELVVAKMTSDNNNGNLGGHAWIISKILGCDSDDEFCEYIFNSPTLFTVMDFDNQNPASSGVFGRFVTTGFKNSDGTKLINGYAAEDGLHISSYHSFKGYGQFNGDYYMDWLGRTNRDRMWNGGDFIGDDIINAAHYEGIHTGNYNLPDNANIAGAERAMTPVRYLDTIIEKISGKRPLATLYHHNADNQLFGWNRIGSGVMSPANVFVRAAGIIHPLIGPFINARNLEIGRNVMQRGVGLIGGIAAPNALEFRRRQGGGL